MTTLAQPVVAPLAADLARHGDAPAVVTADGTLTYRALDGRVRDVADRLGPVRRLVAVAVRNDVASLVAYLGAVRGGHAVLLLGADGAGHAPVVAAYDPDVVLRAAGPGPDDDVALDERRPGTAHDLHPDLALLLSTSGSTGSPKLVRLSHENVAANAEAIAESLGIRPTDRAATTLPMHYCYGLSVVHSHLARGAALVLTDLSVVDPCFWRLVRDAGATTFAAVPYTFELLDRVGFGAMDLPALRYVTQAGGRLAPDVVRRYAELGQARGWDLVVMYGQTEATARMAVLPPGLAATHPGVIGRPVPGGELRVEPLGGDADGEVHDGSGELVYTGPNVMLGYAESPADLALGRTVTELRTGDLGRLRPDGLVEITGRRSRFAKVVGLRVDLDAVERVLADLGLTAAAAGAPDGAAGERVVVAVEGEQDGAVQDGALLAKVLAERLGVPRGAVVVHAVERLPRLASGKVDVPAVRALGAAAAPTASSEAPAPERGAATDVRRIFREELGRPVSDDDTFVGLGGDSLSYVATSVRLEAALGHLPADWHVTPVGDLVPRPRPAGRLARLLPPLETSIALRAVAIIMIIGTHADLFMWSGTAHVLVAVAGFNFARFQLVGDRAARLRRHLRSIARVVVPSVAFIAVAAALTERYTLANVALLNAVVGPDTWTQQWHFWFVEVLVYVLLGMAALLAVPWVDRAERRFPLGVPLALLGVGLLTRFEVVDPGVPHTAPVLWLFALGWVLARVRGPLERVAASGLVLLTVPGFFDDPRREAVTMGGLLLLTWCASLPVPARLHRLLGVLASASLYAYLTHWVVYPPLVPVHPALATAVSLVVGVAYWALVTRAPSWLRALRAAHGATLRRWTTAPAPTASSRS